MNINKAIGTLSYCKAMLTFDPLTGEDVPLELQNEDNQDLYHACSLAIEALQDYKMWTSVDDKLPETTQVVLVYYKNEVEPCIFDAHSKQFWGMDTRTLYGIKWWRFLPSPPEDIK